MTDQEKDRIECAIRHIQTAADVDPWAAEIAVEAMRKLLVKDNHDFSQGLAKDTISRQAAIETARTMYERCDTLDMLDYCNLMLTALKELPSAQPQIIRCKDCKYACIDPERESDEIYCSENDFWKDDDWFCGNAERRTDDGD